MGEENLEVDEAPGVWTSGHERILIDWADKAMCYRWLHARSHQRFSMINTYFTIPVIIMSTLTGTANFAQDRVPEAYRGYYSMGVGFINILAGIVTTIQQFLKISELNEAHRVSAISWDKFYRRVKIELSKPATERQNVKDFLKHCTEEYDRLMETSPSIQMVTIELFDKTFRQAKLSPAQLESFSRVKKPEICDILESVEMTIYKEPMLPTNFKKVMHEVAQASDMDHVSKKRTVMHEFVSTFEAEMHREPTKKEIVDNLESDQLNISDEDVDDFLLAKCEAPLTSTI